MTEKPTEFQLLRSFWQFVKPDKKYLLLTLWITPLVMATIVIQPWLIKIGIDRYISKGNSKGLVFVSSVFLLLVILRYVFESVYTYLLAIVGQKTLLRIRKNIFEHLVRLSQTSLQKTPLGVLLTRATADVEAIGESITAGVVTVLLDFLTIVAIYVVMFYLHWKLALFILLFSIPLILTLNFIRSMIRKTFALSRDILGSLNSFLTERLNSIFLVKLYSQESTTFNEFENKNKQYRNLSFSSGVWDSLMFSVTDGAGTVFLALCVWFYVKGYAGAITLGLLIAFIDYFQKLLRPLQEFSGKVAEIQRAMAAIEKVHDLLELPIREPSSSKENMQLQPLSVSFQNVSFSYTNKIPTLTDLSFSIQAGEKVAIQGASGSGKSTLGELLVRNYEGYSGSILLGNKEIKDIPFEEISQQIVFLQPESGLFPETIRFNLSLGKTGSHFESEAYMKKPLFSLLTEYQLNLDSVLQDAAQNLSKGKQQLISFLRLALFQHPCLVLDSITSGWDNELEEKVIEMIWEEFPERTILFITNNPTILQKMDKIITLEKGRLVSITS